jgi:WD40 repeat protein
VAATTPLGLCPQCLVRLGLAAGTPDPASPADEASDTPPSSPSAPASGPTPRFGDYELLDEIGRGGMGVVYRAHQVSLDRHVALKMILFGPLASVDQIRRFRTEASAAAALQHPNIVAVHEVGVHGGQHYLVMDLVDGPNLGGLVKDKPLPAKRAAAYLKSIAEAIHFAHEHGILHRDLKPSNVLVGSDDRPRVADFGLARRLGTDSSLTLTGQMLGSPNYIPPEQAAVGGGKVGRSADVYGLGAILYHLLTARPPFQAETIPQTIQLVTGAEPLSPRVLVPSVPRDLETICLKCLEKDPAKRYPTAQALVEELDRFLKGEPILARPVGTIGKAWRWCQRRPAIAGLTCALALTSVGGFAGVLTQWRRAETGRLEALRNAYAANMNLAGRHAQSDNWGAVVDLLNRCKPGKRQADLRGWEWRYLWRLSQGDEVATLGRHGAWVGGVAFSPDGNRVATAGADGVARLWDWRTGVEVRSINLGPTNPATGLAFSPDGRLLAVQGRMFGSIWDLRAWRELQRVQGSPELYPADLAFSPDGRLLALHTAGADGKPSVRLWDVDSNTEYALLTDVSGNWTLAFSPDGRLLATGGFKDGIQLWDVARRRLLRTFGMQRPTDHKREQIIDAVQFSPDGKLLAAGDWSRCIRLYDTASCAEVAMISNHVDNVCAVRFDPEGQTLFSASADQTIKAFEVPSGLLLSSWKGHHEEVLALDCSPDGTMLASGSRDGVVKLWRTTPKESRDSVLRPTTRRVLRGKVEWPWLVPSTDGQHILLVETNSAITVRAAGTLEVNAQFSLPEVRAGLAVSARAGLIAALTVDGRVGLFDWESGETRILVSAPTAKLLGGEFSPDGRTLILLYIDSSGLDRVDVWDVAGGAQLGAFLTPFNSGDWAVDFSPDSRVLAVGSEDDCVHLWDCRDRRKIGMLNHPREFGVWAVRFSHNGRTLATAGQVGVRLWNVQTHGQVQWLGREDRVSRFSIAFSPDDQRIAAGTARNIVVWDVSTGRELLTLPGHSTYVQAMFFPDDDTLVSMSMNELIVRRAASLVEAEATASRR